MIPLLPRFQEDWRKICVPRLGAAHLTRLAFHGADLWPLWNELMDRVTDDAMGSGIGMDLAAIAQLRGDKPTGLAIQSEALGYNQLFCTNLPSQPTRLRVLAIAAASDIGANTPVEFLLQGAEIDLATWYVVPGKPVPDPMPAHDVAIVVAPATADGETALAIVDALSDRWPCPILNVPSSIRALERDRLYHRLQGAEGLHIPATLRVSRGDLDAATEGTVLSATVPSCGTFPIIVRPLGSHAGFGLARIDRLDALKDYLRERPEGAFFVSPYIDYTSADGLFRKYRIVMIEGKAHACHMAIADQWKVWYLNADMAVSVPHRIEEASFMEFFDGDFAARHDAALTAMAVNIGLDYFIVDCAEMPDGRLLIFEADNCAIVHDMDPPNVYPYKPAQMRKISDAFVAMLNRYAHISKTCAA